MATVSILTLLKVKFLVRSTCFLPNLLNKNCKRSISNSRILQCFSSIPDQVITKTQNSNNAKVSGISNKTEQKPKITLFLPDNSIIITDLENAHKISKRRGLTLMKVEEQKKLGRQTYKLVRQMEQFEQDLQEEPETEEEDVPRSTRVKTIQMSSKITMHDVNVKIKHAIKLLEKEHKVKIILMNGSYIQDKIIKAIETNTKNYATLQKVVKSMNMIFTLIPHSKKTYSNDSSNDNVNKTREE